MKKSDEIQLPCPECQHPSFYFNRVKGVGFCHRCQWTPRREDLVRVLGRRGQTIILAQEEQPREQHEPGEVHLPDDARPLFVGDIPHCELCEETIGHIEHDRFVSREKQARFQLHATENRVYIPIHDEQGKLVNYLGRVKWWRQQPPDVKSKLYAPGAHTSHYLYCWNDFRARREIALVENTFNALWLRELGVTTNFGSSVSETQLTKIFASQVESLVLIWDEGAEERAETAVRKLRSGGVRAVFARISGQPDQHSVECLTRIVRHGHHVARSWSGDRGFDVDHDPAGACIRGEAQEL